MLGASSRGVVIRRDLSLRRSSTCQPQIGFTRIRRFINFHELAGSNQLTGPLDQRFQNRNDRHRPVAHVLTCNICTDPGKSFLFLALQHLRSVFQLLFRGVFIRYLVQQPRHASLYSLQFSLRMRPINVVAKTRARCDLLTVDRQMLEIYHPYRSTQQHNLRKQFRQLRPVTDSEVVECSNIWNLIFREEDEVGAILQTVLHFPATHQPAQIAVKQHLQYHFRVIGHVAFFAVDRIHRVQTQPLNYQTIRAG